MQRQSLLKSLLLFLAIATVTLGARGDVRLKSSVGDVPFELVGQVQNIPGTPPTSLQFGYLSAIEGLDDIFTTSNRCCRTGPRPDGDFVRPATFADGLAIQTSTFRHQVVLDFATQKFTTVFVNEVESVEPFVFNGRKTRLGKVGDTLRISVSGLPGDLPGRFDIAGYAVAADPSYFVDDAD
jgi:hypothetical protein